MLQGSVAAAFLLTVLISASACTPADPYATLPMEWRRDPASETNLPASVRVFVGENQELPLRAYRVDVDLSDPNVHLRAVSSSDSDGRQTPSELARSNNACVLINGGYYRIDRDDRGRHIGLLVSDSEQIEPALGGLVWQRVRYPVTRATIGAVPDSLPEITWVSASADSIVSWTAPFDNRLGRPALQPDFALAEPWPAEWALSAGPALVMDGRAHSFREEEGFFDQYIPRIHPRSATGITADGRLLLVVVDGRQPHSRGVYLEELATIMRDLGAVQAMNLDGGGSSALVVDGKLFNRPSGTSVEREIASAILVDCNDYDN